MKRVACLLIALLFLTIIPITSFASSSETKAADATGLTLDDALKNIEQNNFDIKLLDEKIKVYERQYKDAVDRANAYKGMSFDGEDRSDKIKHLKDKSLTPIRKLYDLNNLKHDREEKIKSLMIDVERQFTSVSMLQDNTQNIKAELDNLNKKISETELKIKKGLLTSTSLTPLKSQKIQLASQLSSFQRQLNEALLTLKKNLGIELSKEINLSPLKLELKKFDDADVEKRISEALENTYDFKNLTKDLELTKIEYEIVKDNSDLDANNQDLNQLEIDLKNKEVTLNDVKPTLELNLWSTYFNLKNLEDEIEIQKLNLESAEITLNTTSAKVKTGKDTTTNELNARLALDKQKNALQKAINDYMLAVKNFEKLINQ